MGKFTLIPQDTFEGLQLDAGVLLKTFEPETGAAPKDEISSAPPLEASIPPACLHTATSQRMSIMRPRI